MHFASRLQTFFHPERFQGWGKHRNYFEGWYFKVVSADEHHAFAVIPGIAFDKAGEGHAFIQVLDGKNKTSEYHKFPISSFKPSVNEFSVQVGENVFSGDGVLLQLPSISGSLQFRGNVGWPKPIYSPGIMGPYAFAPFMECYHGIVSMDHILAGVLRVKGVDVDFEGGRGYLEKDWGRSFPSAYVWMQSNHFESPGISIKASVAMIPWLTGSFVGFIAGIWLKDRLIRFTTYNRSKLLKLEVDKDAVRLRISNPRYYLEVNGDRDQATELASPIQGAMDGRIEETMGAALHVILTDRKSGNIVFEGKGTSAGLEVAGNIKDIVTSG